jgi:hypothetical protein
LTFIAETPCVALSADLIAAGSRKILNSWLKIRMGDNKRLLPATSVPLSMESA